MLDALPLSYTGIFAVKAANGRCHPPFTYYTEKISLSSFKGKELPFQGKELPFRGKELPFRRKRAVFFLNIPFHSIIQSIPLFPSPNDKFETGDTSVLKSAAILPIERV